MLYSPLYFKCTTDHSTQTSFNHVIKCPCDQMRSNIHRHQRTPREESIVFPSSSGEESLLAILESRQTVRDTQVRIFKCCLFSHLCFLELQTKHNLEKLALISIF